MKKNQIKYYIGAICIVILAVIGMLKYQHIYAADPTYWFNYSAADYPEGSEIEMKNVQDQLIIKSKDGFELGTNDIIDWQSSAEEVVKVTATGVKSIAKLDRIGPGYSNITAIITHNGSTYTVTCKLKVDYAVDETEFSQITLSNEKALILDTVGTNTAKEVKLLYTNAFSGTGSQFIINNPSVSWKSADENIAKYDSATGKIVAVGAGMTTISIHTNSISQNVAPLIKTFKVIVAPRAIDPDSGSSDYLANFDVNYNPGSTLNIQTNAKLATNLTWKFYDSNQTLMDPAGKIEYTVNSNDGLIRIKNARAGTYYIRGYVNASYMPTDPTISASVPFLTIKLVVPIKTPTDVVMNVGDTYNIFDNSNIPSAGTFNYSSLNSTIAEVDNNGVITARSEGTTTIRMTVVNTSEVHNLTVTVIDGIALNYTTAKIYTSGTLLLKAITTDNSSPVVWSTSNPSVATVTNGLVKGVAKGTATITASQTIKGVVKSATCIINVQQSVNKITIDPATVSISINDYKTLKAVIEPQGLNNVSLTWISSDEKVVKITDVGDLTATVQGLTGGTAVITAINQENVVVGYCQVTVKEKVTKITLSDTSLNLSLAKKTYQINGYVSPDTATNKKINWSTTNSKVATVDSNGLVTLVAAGTATIVATSDDNPSVTAYCNLTVEIPAASLVLDEISKVMYVGDSVRMGYVITPTNAANRNVTWSSTNSSVVSVDSTGLISAKAAGTAIVIVKTADGSLMSTCTITVKQKATGITFDVNNLELYVGQTYSIKVNVTPESTTDYSLTWESTDTSVATVDDKGKVTGVASGKTTIMAKTSIGTIVYCNVTVKQQPTGIQLNYKKKTIVIGESFKIKATVKPSTASNEVSVVWSSSNTKVAKVSSAGNVSGLKGGTAIITCKTKDGKFTEFCIVTVIERVTSVKLNKSSYKLGLHKSFTLKATVKTNAATNPKLKWTSSNPKIATVNSKGKVTGKRLGYVVIKAIAKDGSGEYATCTVRVVKAVSSLSLNRTSVTTVVGRSFKLKAIVRPKNATYKTVNWTSSDKKVAIVDSKGNVTALSDGTVTIKATAKDNSGRTAYCYVIVQPRTPANSVTIINQNLTMVVGETTTIQKAINPTNSTDRFTWESDNRTVASVDPSSGRVVARTPGIANITVMTESGKTATTKVTVVGLNTTSLVLEQYSTYRLSVIGITSGVTWDIDDSEIATVTNGLVTSKRIGTTTITATVNGRRLTCRLRVVKIK